MGWDGLNYGTQFIAKKRQRKGKDTRRARKQKNYQDEQDGKDKKTILFFFRAKPYFLSFVNLPLYCCSSRIFAFPLPFLCDELRSVVQPMMNCVP